MVGDSAKGFSSKRQWIRFQLELCRGHPENLELGKFVMDCITQLGVPWSRIADRAPHEGEPHGAYRWQSYYSEVFMWFHLACLGLTERELTSYDPVRMNRMLSASRENRIWFLRGVADSDGSVNIANKTVQITTDPNGEFVRAIFLSLGVPAREYQSHGCSNVSIKVADASSLRIFNPLVETHRAKLLRKLATARVFQRKWPDWLDRKVKHLLRTGLDPSLIRNRILDEDRVYVKLKTIRSRQSRD